MISESDLRKKNGDILSTIVSFTEFEFILNK